MAFNGTEGEAISLETASQMTAKYRDANPNTTIAHFFGKEILNQLLEQENCVGIRMYYGMQDGEKELVLVGVDSEQNDILELVVDRSMPCPKACSMANPLNS